MLRFLEQPPVFLFFTGKGGVGKTSLACASAVRLAEAGKPVLLVSTDPASNVGQVFGVTIGNRITDGITLVVYNSSSSRKSGERSPHVRQGEELSTDLPVGIGIKYKAFVFNLCLETSGVFRKCTSEEHVRIVNIESVGIENRLSVDTLDTVSEDLTPVAAFLVYHVRSGRTPHTFDSDTISTGSDRYHFVLGQDAPSGIDFPLEILTPYRATHSLDIVTTLGNQTGIGKNAAETTGSIDRNGSWEVSVVSGPISNRETYTILEETKIKSDFFLLS